MKTLTLSLQIKSTPSPEWEGGIYVVTKSLRGGGWQEIDAITYVLGINIDNAQTITPEAIYEIAKEQAIAGTRGIFTKFGSVDAEITALLDDVFQATYRLTFRFQAIEGQSHLFNFHRVEN